MHTAAWLRTVALSLLLLAGGCATQLSETVRPGTPREQVLQAWGTPTASYSMPSGTRLQYSRQPFGRQVYNIDLDAAGRVAAFSQALQPASLDRVPVDGSWTTEDVLREFGPPQQISRVGDFDGDVWTYRWAELNNPRFFHIYLDRKRTVRRAHSTDEVVDRRLLF